MKSIEVLALGIRLVGIWVIIEILQYLAYSYSSIQQWMYASPGESVAMWIVYHGVVGVAMVVFSFILIKFPVTVSHWILPKTNNDEPVFNGSIDDIRIAAFTIIGVYILSWAIPDFFYNASILLFLNNEGAINTYHAKEKIEYIIDEVITVLEIAIGLYLCFQAKGLNSLLMKMRGLGTK